MPSIDSRKASRGGKNRPAGHDNGSEPALRNERKSAVGVLRKTTRNEPLGTKIKKRIAAIGAGVILLATLAAIGPERDRQRADETPVRPTVTSRVNFADSVEVVAAPYSADERRRTRNELHVMLDSMLITERMPPGTPFKDRKGEVNDERVLEVMREIDTTLGGRIEWPNVYVTEGLIDGGATGRYRTDPDTWDTRTVDPAKNAGRPPGGRLGIEIDKGYVDKEFDSGKPDWISVRNLIVHELQHAVSWDNHHQLTAAAAAGNEPYHPANGPFSESRADMAMLVYNEMDQRSDTPGPRLNELPAEQRRDVIASVLTDYLAPDPDISREELEAVMHFGLKEDRYLHHGLNYAWNDVGDERTDRYVYGEDRYDAPEEIFVPTHRSEAERRADLARPLDETAAAWKQEHAARIETFDEWERQMVAAWQGPPPAAAEREEPPAGTRANDRPESREPQSRPAPVPEQDGQQTPRTSPAPPEPAAEKAQTREPGTSAKPHAAEAGPPAPARKKTLAERAGDTISRGWRAVRGSVAPPTQPAPKAARSEAQRMAARMLDEQRGGGQERRRAPAPPSPAAGNNGASAGPGSRLNGHLRAPAQAGPVRPVITRPRHGAPAPGPTLDAAQKRTPKERQTATAR